ncbi:DUF262 domain-containing protein [Candidatus Saccharibacteria bacterium]|nr:DUF262 domain-containing protein [Candidatus Saccharibacteria bacterium]
MDNETFTPANQDISTIFLMSAIYVVPNYQRQYSWGDEQLNDLWDDLTKAFLDDPEKEYFLGSIVVVDNKRGRHELVDGQQRLTTLMIMLNVLYRTFPGLNQESSEIQSADNEAIRELIYHKKSQYRLRLQVRPHYDTIFNTEIMNRERFDNIEAVTKAEMKKNDPTYKFRNTAKFFYDKFMEFREQKGEEELGKFVNYILYKVDVIKIRCTNKAFAIRMFLILNDRGLDLSAADIIKSYILDKCFEMDEEENGALGSKFDQNWQRIEGICNDCELKMDDYLTLYEYYKLKSNPKRQITDELEEIIKYSDVNITIDELYNFAKSLEKVYQDTSPAAYSLRYIPWQIYTLSAMTTAYMVGYEEIEELFRELRRFFYISWVSGKTLSGIKQTSFNLIGDIEEKKPLEKIRGEIDEFIRENHLVREVFESLRDDVFGEKFFKPLMLSIEYEMREKIETAFYPLDRNIHMDHIIAREFDKKAEEWPGLTKEVMEPYLNKLGNMALLFWQKNEEALNFGLERKMPIYRGEDEASSGTQSFATTREVIDWYNREFEEGVRRVRAGEISANEFATRAMERRRKYLIEKIKKLLEIEEPKDDSGLQA